MGAAKNLKKQEVKIKLGSQSLSTATTDQNKNFNRLQNNLTSQIDSQNINWFAAISFLPRVPFYSHGVFG